MFCFMIFFVAVAATNQLNVKNAFVIFLFLLFAHTVETFHFEMHLIYLMVLGNYVFQYKFPLQIANEKILSLWEKRRSWIWWKKRLLPISSA